MVLNVMTLFLSLPVFSAMYNQTNSRWVFQATRMNGDLGFYTIKPDQMVMTMTIFSIVLVPIFDYVIYPLLAKIGIKSQLQKIVCGFVCSSVAFVIAAIVEWKVESYLIHVLWLLPQYFLIAVSDILVWISLLNFAYTQAPDTMKSVIASFMYIMVAGGDLIVTVVSGTNFLDSQMHEYLMYSCLMVINTILFAFLAKSYKYVDKM